MRYKLLLLSLCSLAATQAHALPFSVPSDSAGSAQGLATLADIQSEQQQRALAQTADRAQAHFVRVADDISGPTGSSDLDLQVLRARAQLGLGQTRDARRTAEAVLAQSPDDLGALRVLATSEEAAGRWRQASILWDRVYAISNDPAALARREALKLANASNVTFGAFFEGAIDADEQYGLRATAAWKPLAGPDWTALVETRRAEDSVATGPGGVQDVISLERQRLEIGVANDFEWGVASARLLVTNDVVGARVGVGKTWPNGAVDLEVGYRAPYWLFSEGIANNASTDYVGASGSARFGWASLRASVRKSQYAIEDNDDIATSVRVTAGADVALTGGANPLIASYVVDGEYYDDIELFIGPGNTTYTPIPFVDREVHSVGLYKTFGNASRNFVRLGGGYRGDRYGASGPYASAWAEREIGDKTDIGVRVEYSKPSIRGSSESDSWGYAEIYLRRSF